MLTLTVISIITLLSLLCCLSVYYYSYCCLSVLGRESGGDKGGEREYYYCMRGDPRGEILNHSLLMILKEFFN